MDKPEAAPGSATGFVWSNVWMRALFYTLCILFMTRVGHFIPLPGLDPEVLNTLRLQSPGAWVRLGIFALGLTPFVTAWAIMEVFRGRQQPEQRVGSTRRWLTLGFALFQGLGIATGLEHVPRLVHEPGLVFRLTVMLTLAGGTMLLLWLGEQITRRGFCDGIWLIVASTAVADLPGSTASLLHLNQAGEIGVGAFWIISAVATGLVALVCLVEMARRFIPVVSRSGASEPATTRPLAIKVDNATVLPGFIAALLVGLPAAAGIDFGTGLMGHVAASTAVILLVTYPVTAAHISPRAVADGLRSENRLVEGAANSNQSADAIRKILSSLTFINGLYIAVVFMMPAIILHLLSPPLLVGGANLMIVVIVMLDILSRATRQGWQTKSPG